MTDEFANKLRRALDGNADAIFSIYSSDFDEWLKFHDAEVRMDAIIARDTRTPAELLQAAWDAAYPVPEGRTIPGGTPNVMKYKDSTIMWNVMGSTYEIEFIETDRIRTLEPLPPVIPDGTPAVWASTSDGILVRRILVNTDHITRQWIDMYDTKYTDEQLIDPVPIPEEES